jgi:amphiphysin
MNRQFGKLMSKGQGDNAKVSVLIADYEHADKTLTKVGAIPLTRLG